ncbi:hypothetical protein QZH41_014806 [Actinostola sp. cb2023]|nr:hypothetical protein QZH41_014806 [Actinostola sp. cb2023]
MADQRKSTQSTYTKRGRGSCPNCEEVYVCRYKPEKCPKCEFKDMDYSTLLTKLLSFDILLEIREFFKRGHPLTNVINCKIETLKRKSLKENLPTDNQLEYIQTLLYNGFYCFEAITVRDMDTTVCGICGYCPEVLLGDGNEKNCCRTGQIVYNVDPADQSPTMSPCDFQQKLKRRWLERLIIGRNM